MDSLISVWRETPSGCISHCIYSVPCLSVCMHDMKCPQIFHYGRKKKADRHITDTEVTTSHMTTWFHWSDNAHRQDNRRSSAPSRGSSSDHETSETTKASGDLSGRFTTQSSRTKGLKQNTNTCIFINTITCGAYFEFDLVNSSNKVLTSAVRYGPNFISR